jgi:hypothetical protein
MRANRDRLRDLVNFEKVIAPFDGVITARATDIGALINAGSSAQAKPLFRIAQVSPLRIYVKVPQNYSTFIKPNMQVQLRFAEYPGKLFSAKLLNTADAINPTTRTLLAQFVLENKDNLILPGGYTEVIFSLGMPNNIVRIPVNTLIFQKEGLQVATLDKNHRVILKSISVSRDFGTDVEVRSGIRAGDLVILNPSDSIMNGETVRLASKKKSDKEEENKAENTDKENESSGKNKSEASKKPTGKTETNKTESGKTDNDSKSDNNQSDSNSPDDSSKNADQSDSNNPEDGKTKNDKTEGNKSS